MLAARLHGPADLRVEEIPPPGPPGQGQVRLRVRTTGICGSDLHSYLDARIGDTPVTRPLILGHEFCAVVEAVGDASLNGEFEPLSTGQRVAVDPAQPCGHCPMCEQGNPNLCWRLHFCGNHPDGGSLCQQMLMPARSCFPVPDTLSDVEAALLEPLGVALHAIDLARIRVGDALAILGAGPIGLLILQVARLAGADPIFVVDPLPWRLKCAPAWGGVPIEGKGASAVAQVLETTHGRGVDLAIEAAWADTSVGDAVEMARLGGRVVLVGIPGDDRLTMKHSTARRKGLTLRLCRRMKHVYPRAIRLATERRVDLSGLVSHEFPLRQAPHAFRLNAAYADHVLKVIIRNEP